MTLTEPTITAPSHELLDDIQAEDAITHVTLYRDGTTWCYAAWYGQPGIAGAYDHSDTLDAESHSDAQDEIAALWPSAQVHRVDDR